MGFRKKSQNQKKKNREQRAAAAIAAGGSPSAERAPKKPRNGDWAPTALVMENARFEAYYKAQVRITMPCMRQYYARIVAQ